MASNTAKLIVGYTVRMKPAAMTKGLILPIQADRRLKDPAKCENEAEKAKAQAAIDADVQARTKKFEAEAGFTPYLGTFNRVVIVDLKNKRNGRWNSEGRRPFGDKPSMAEVIVQWLLKGYPTAWGGIDEHGKDPVARFLGFRPGGFLDLLGVESTLPESEAVPPPKLWYSNSDHRDIGKAVARGPAADLPLKEIINARRPKASKEWKQFDAWTEPHMDADLDAKLCIELAAQLGFLQE